MISKYREKIKSFLLFILICTSLVQIGILWRDKAHGFPFAFLSEIFDSDKQNTIKIEEAVDSYISPKSVYICDGDQSYYIYESNDEQYQFFWQAFKNDILKKLVEQKPIASLNLEEWSDIIQRPSIILNFRYSFPLSIINISSNIEVNNSNSLGNIYKIAIAPWDNINENIFVIYINDGANINSYEVKVDINDISSDNIMERILGMQMEKSITKYTRIKQTLTTAPINEDMIGYLKNKYIEIKTLEISLPDILNRSKSDLEDIKTAILANKRDSYSATEDTKNSSLLFTETNQIFRLYTDGVLEYKYVLGEIDKGRIEKAFINAITFIEERQKLKGDIMELKLTKVTENNNSYKFYFNYFVDDKRILLKDNNDEVMDALVVDAIEERVIQLKWIIRDLKYDEFKENYNINFAENYKTAYITYSKLRNSLNETGNMILDAYLVYPSYIDTTITKTISAKWLFETIDQNYIVAPSIKE